MSFAVPGSRRRRGARQSGPPVFLAEEDDGLPGPEDAAGAEEDAASVWITGWLAEMPWQQKLAIPAPPEPGCRRRRRRDAAERQLAGVSRHRGCRPSSSMRSCRSGCRAQLEYLIQECYDLQADPDFSLVGERASGTALLRRGRRRASNRSEVFFDATRPTKQIDDSAGDSCASRSRRCWIRDFVRDVGVGWGVRVRARRAGRARSICRAAWPRPGADRRPRRRGSQPCLPDGFLIAFPTARHERRHLISVLFRPGQKIRAVFGTLTDSSGTAVEAFLSSPEGPLSKNITEPVIALHPRRALRTGPRDTAARSRSRRSSTADPGDCRGASRRPRNRMTKSE